MSNQYSAQPTNSSDSDSDRLRTLLDNLSNLKSKLHHFTVIDELGQPLGEITDLILDESHQLNLVIALPDAGLGGSPVLLNGRRIKKVSVQTQSVFVDITKADTQFLPEYSSTEGLSSLHQAESTFETPSPETPFSEPFANLDFSEETAASIHAFSGENFTYPTTADRELAASLFTTEPNEPGVPETDSLVQEWELSTSTPTEDVLGSWNQESGTLSDLDLMPEQNLDLSDAVPFSESQDLSQTLTEDFSGLELSSIDLFGTTEEFSLSETATEPPTADFSFDSEPPSESLASDLERLDLNLDNDWSQLGSVTETTDTSNSFELTLDETFTQATPEVNLGDVEGAIADSIVPDQSVNPFAGELPDLSFDPSPEPVADLSSLDWTDANPIEESATFALQQDEFSFDLPASETVGSLENNSFEFGDLEPASPAVSSDLALEWNDADEVLNLQESFTPPVSEAVSLDLSAPEASQPDTIQSLSDLDLFAEEPAQPIETGFSDEFATPFAEDPLATETFAEETLAEEMSSPAINYDYEQPITPLVQETEVQDEWLTVAGAGAAGLAAGMAGSSIVEAASEPPIEEVVSAATYSEDPDAAIPLLEEQLNVEYQRRKVGEVIIRKQIETRMVQVPVRYEKLVIEQVSPERKSLAEVDLSQGALDNIELTGVEQKPTVSGDFASPAVASQALDAIAKALQNRCKRVRIEIELEDGQMQQAYQDWFDECSQL